MGWGKRVQDHGKTSLYLFKRSTLNVNRLVLIERKSSKEQKNDRSNSLFIFSQNRIDQNVRRRKNVRPSFLGSSGNSCIVTKLSDNRWLNSA